MKASQQFFHKTFNHRSDLYASLQEVLMIRDEKADQRLLSILPDMLESTDNSQKVCETVAVLEIFYTVLKYNFNELHYRSVREQSLWRYLWCNFECNWQVLEDVSLYFMSEEYDCERFCEDLHTEDSQIRDHCSFHSSESMWYTL